MDKGVKNNHKSHITVKFGKTEDADARPDIVLAPGFNRLTQDQYDAIKSRRVIKNYFDKGLLSDVKAPPVKASSEPEAQAKSLEKMTKDELIAEAARLEVTLEGGETKAQILEILQALKNDE